MVFRGGECGMATKLKSQPVEAEEERSPFQLARTGDSSEFWPIRERHSATSVPAQKVAVPTEIDHNPSNNTEKLSHYTARPCNVTESAFLAIASQLRFISDTVREGLST